MRDQVFISYSHEDQRWLDLLKLHLRPYERNRLEVWDDTKIHAGAKWQEEIEKALQSAKVAVLLVSPNFLASDFIVDNELPKLLKAAQEDGLRIIWVPVSASAYRATEIQHYQAASNPKEPLNTLDPGILDQELVRICELIESSMTDTDAGITTKPRGPKIVPTTLPVTSSSAKSLPSSCTLKIVVSGLVIVMLIGAAVFLIYWQLNKETPTPLTTIPFSDHFDNLTHWHTPSAGWTIEEGQLLIDSQTELGFARNVNYADFGMVFRLKLENAKGAAWAVRVQPNGRDYYLFYLSGPEGQFPNRFITYVVRNNVIPKMSEKSVALNEKLEANGQYRITVIVNKNRIAHTLQSVQTTNKFNLGEFIDEANTFTSGSFGFRTIGGEKFSIDYLDVQPPNINQH